MHAHWLCSMLISEAGQPHLFEMFKYAIICFILFLNIHYAVIHNMRKCIPKLVIIFNIKFDLMPIPCLIVVMNFMWCGGIYWDYQWVFIVAAWSTMTCIAQYRSAIDRWHCFCFCRPQKIKKTFNCKHGQSLLQMTKSFRPYFTLITVPTLLLLLKDEDIASNPGLHNELSICHINVKCLYSALWYVWTKDMTWDMYQWILIESQHYWWCDRDTELSTI